jgi:hypothetical protein
MKANKLFAVMAIASMGLFAGQAMAQGNDDDAPPPKMSEFNENEEVTDTYNDKVTIDSGNNYSSNAGGSSSYGNDAGERKERLRVYSGKHDGNNVIYDPR